MTSSYSESPRAKLQSYGEDSDLEKRLQTLIESNLEVLLGVRFLASKYSTGKTHAGRVDSLGWMKTSGNHREHAFNW